MTMCNLGYYMNQSLWKTLTMKYICIRIVPFKVYWLLKAFYHTSASHTRSYTDGRDQLMCHLFNRRRNHSHKHDSSSFPGPRPLSHTDWRKSKILQLADKPTPSSKPRSPTQELRVTVFKYWSPFLPKILWVWITLQCLLAEFGFEHVGGQQLVRGFYKYSCLFQSPTTLIGFGKAIFDWG